MPHGTPVLALLQALQAWIQSTEDHYNDGVSCQEPVIH